MELKNYQERTLDKLSAYLKRARYTAVEDAFKVMQEAQGYSSQYRPLEGLEDVPFVCTRIPTGGGKTLLAAHSIAIAGTDYMDKDYPLVLWLVPTDTIRKQTIETLRDIHHPNRQRLEIDFGGNIAIFDITEFTQVRSNELFEKTCIFVATFASLRITDTDKRNVYAHNENFEPHFSKISLQPYMEKNDDDTLKYSFMNLIAWLRPLVIVDEAHNNKSKLSIETLVRIRPAVVLEFTATPDVNSNVLYKVSASELKAEQMIKLPVRLTEDKNWERTISLAVQKCAALEQMAKEEPEYIRPIVLFQAQKKNEDITIDVLYKHLLEQENLPKEQIAIVTGDQKELDGINLFDINCPIRYVITVQALKEGWDCSFAYVLCSTVAVQSTKDAEQLLGRIMRMPYVKMRKNENLNRAYAYVTVDTWGNAVNKIRDNLIGMGFDEKEAQICVEQTTPLFTMNPQPRTITIAVTERPNFTVLTEALQQQTKVESCEDGTYEVEITLTKEEDIAAIEANADKIFTYSENIQQVRTLNETCLALEYGNVTAPAKAGKTFDIEMMCLDFGYGKEVIDKDTLVQGGFDLLKYSHALENFVVNEETKTYEFDIDGYKLKESFLNDSSSLDFDMVSTWSIEELIYWLNHRLKQDDVSYPVLGEFIRQSLEYLLNHKGISLEALVRLRFYLQKILEEKIRLNRKQALKDGFQSLLFDDTTYNEKLCLGEKKIFQDGYYPVKQIYKGSFVFKKHFFPIIADMNNEEIECAKILDCNDNVEFWVRNLERNPEYAFWLQTSTDKFYPDFIAKLIDGRIVAIEYKGANLITNDDSKEKAAVGHLWANLNKEKYAFAMVEKCTIDGVPLDRQLQQIIG